jgi:hypothetical protein
MSVPADLDRKVRRRAKDRCEYCRIHQSLQGATFHVEHIVPTRHGGETCLENLALACPSCNLQKSDRLLVLDSDSATHVRLYHPRLDDWAEHFCWDGFAATGVTDIGRATVSALDFNHPRRLRIREAESRFGLFPP